ncbi:MAG: hypothetical protein PF694_02720 [Bacteroidetes bacterium]|jgi:hypothetical protein|nr:hypothetical protein [Bacteroidota bacterium]
MKTKIFGLMAILLGMSVLMTSCKKDDDEDPAIPATILDLTISADNATAAVAFSEAVYKMADKTGNLDAASFSVTISGGTATLGNFTVTHTAGTSTATLNLELNGVANGSEELTVAPASATSIYNAAGAATPTTESANVMLKETGIIGQWISAGANVAPLLISAGIDSIFADFKADNSYVVESFTADGSKTTLTGSFVQEKSDTGNIWTIVVNQSSPSSLISEGIFEVTANGTVTMKYEIAQTNPEIPGVTPATPAGGFGSTSGGAFGMLNVQTYVKY